MNFQEIVVLIIVALAAAFSLFTFLRQFASGKTSCSSCSCEPIVQKAAERNRNSIRFKKINP